jgi:hypothetical protein
MRQEADRKMMDDYLTRKLGTLPGTGGRPLVPASSSTVEGTLQRKCACQQSGGQCEECRNAETVQRKSAGAAQDAAPPIVDQVLSSSGRPLDKAVRDSFEPRFGCDFSKVRIHDGAHAAESALAVHAHAYTVGNDIAFAAGRYAPQSEEGRRLLAHELAHTVQQSSTAQKPAETSPGAPVFTPDKNAAESASASLDTQPRGPMVENAGRTNGPALQRDPDDLCGPDGCLSDEDIYGPLREADARMQKEEEEDKKIRATPIMERISTATNHAYVRGVNSGQHDGLWHPSGEEVWETGYYYKENDERRRLFTYDDKWAVVSIVDGHEAAKLKQAGQELKREKMRAEWQREEAIKAPIDQIASPAAFVQGAAASAINPALGAAVFGVQTGQMIGEAYNACQSGLSLECADKVVPLVVAAGMHGVGKMAGEDVGVRAPEVRETDVAAEIRPREDELVPSPDKSAGAAPRTTEKTSGAGGSGGKPVVKEKPATARELEEEQAQRQETVAAKSGGKGKPGQGAKKGGGAKGGSPSGAKKGGQSQPASHRPARLIVEPGRMTEEQFRSLRAGPNHGVYVYRMIDRDGNVWKWGTAENPFKRVGGADYKGEKLYYAMEVVGGPYARAQALALETDAASLEELGHNIRQNTLAEMKGGEDLIDVVETPTLETDDPLVTIHIPGRDAKDPGVPMAVSGRN